MAHNLRSVGAGEYRLKLVTKYKPDVLAKGSLWEDCVAEI